MCSAYSAVRGENPLGMRSKGSAAWVGVEAAVRLEAIRPAGVRILHLPGRIAGFDEFAEATVQEHNEVRAAGGESLHKFALPFDSAAQQVANQHQEATYQNTYERGDSIHPSMIVGPVK
ncbi:hypothetical protein ACGFIK_06245 [Micromonospora sp. NPDC048871]|uniref:hypothetical protein n=1 Tax=unclassified Micromonospora TaxID=2617518 RepID=UPI002E0F7457|nr:hypothetical protein OIE53_04125 [Micromonospora sp. NBC_01739]